MRQDEFDHIRVLHLLSPEDSFIVISMHIGSIRNKQFHSSEISATACAYDGAVVVISNIRAEVDEELDNGSMPAETGHPDGTITPGRDICTQRNKKSDHIHTSPARGHL